ncbi:Serine/threonine protein kinase [Chondrus crispus]|uniref:Serine/threonine protein kinase n=1 Tax=Chondrus crispus TaxID=2769 RepID=R7QCQ4_CHOCR|nr:Serine/threonine protein kinase [Chondrus crispus]CDF35240.1 Serine/threonine protein kinase [Chondrus crispus]|eukprot:XP_005715059.1 Serine/threonine protein kinase [Chondrus crispus]
MRRQQSNRNTDPSSASTAGQSVATNPGKGSSREPSQKVPTDLVHPVEVKQSVDVKNTEVEQRDSEIGKVQDKNEKTVLSKVDGPDSQPISKYGKPAKLGLKQINYINVHRKDYTGRIELLQGSVEGLAPEDETDLLIVYLRERGQYKANQDSALAALNRAGYSLAQLEKETKPQPSYRRHYHCWLSRPLPKPRPPGLEFKRLLVYEDPGEELTRDDNIILDIMKCLTTVIGGDVQIQSVLIPLSGALLSPSLRKHFVKAAVQVAYSWLQMGLPVREVKILLPDTDITKDLETFEKAKNKLTKPREFLIQQSINYDVFFSYAEGDKEAATEMMEYLRGKNQSIRIFDAEPREVSVRQRGVVNQEITEAISQSRIFLSLLSDDYFHSVECTEAFSLAYCRDFDSQGNFIIPLFWRSCDLTPLARRLVATEGVDCREASFDSAQMLLEEILSALASLKEVSAGEESEEIGFDGQNHDHAEGGAANMNLADKLLMAKEKNDDTGAGLFDQADDIPDIPEKIPDEASEVSAMFFDNIWRDQWATDFSSIVFGPRIGAGGFGEVYKCKWNNTMVAVKTLQKIEDDDPQAVMAEFMVEMKLMSKLSHPNVVAFLGASITAPKLAIILEFMPGGSLYRAIHRRRRNNLGPFPLLKSLWIAFGIAKGMTYLHSQYPVIIHRDLKSPNILLGTNVREVKITDFGLSRLRVKTYVNTGPGGTPEWMAPELLRQDPFEEQSDVYSFGVILWELMMCEKPWKDDHPMQIVFKVGSRGEKLETPPPNVCIPEVRDMIVKCFSGDPFARPKFSELTKTLDYFCHDSDLNKKS